MPPTRRTPTERLLAAVAGDWKAHRALHGVLKPIGALP